MGFHRDPIFLSFACHPLSIAKFKVNNILSEESKEKILSILYPLESDNLT